MTDNAKTCGAGLRLWDYYLLEIINSAAVSMFGYCVFFWSKAHFGYTDTENLALAVVQGGIYMVGAHFGGRLADRIGYDRLLIASNVGMAVLLLAAPRLSAHWVPYAVVGLYYAVCSTTWPALEAAITHIPGRRTVPARLGIYNVAWSVANAFGFVVGGFLFELRPELILWVPCGLHLLQVVWLVVVPRVLAGAGDQSTAGSESEPGRVEPPVAVEVRRSFMWLGWLGNASAYMLITAFVALVPYLGERLGLSPSRTVLLSAGFMFARAVAFVLFWKWEGWHYRRAWSIAALWAAPLCLGASFLTASPLTLVAALVVFGFAVGLSYSGSLYYSMNGGEDKGQQGGLHEAVLGLGCVIGPLIGALGTRLTGNVEYGQAWLIGAALIVSAVVTRPIRIVRS